MPVASSLLQLLTLKLKAGVGQESVEFQAGDDLLKNNNNIFIVEEDPPEPFLTNIPTPYMSQKSILPDPLLSITSQVQLASRGGVNYCVQV